MTPQGDLTQLAERTIDAAIRSFKPWEEESYPRWDGELERVETLLVAAPGTPRRPYLLASIRAQRVLLAFETNKFERVIELSALTPRESPPDDPGLSTVVIFRARSLHAVGRRAEELGEVLAAARACEADDSEFIYFLLRSEEHTSELQSRQYL